MHTYIYFPADISDNLNPILTKTLGVLRQCCAEEIPIVMMNSRSNSKVDSPRQISETLRQRTGTAPVDSMPGRA